MPPGPNFCNCALLTRAEFPLHTAVRLRAAFTPYCFERFFKWTSSQLKTHRSASEPNVAHKNKPPKKGKRKNTHTKTRINSRKCAPGAVDAGERIIESWCQSGSGQFRESQEVLGRVQNSV